MLKEMLRAGCSLTQCVVRISPVVDESASRPMAANFSFRGVWNVMETGTLCE